MKFYVCEHCGNIITKFNDSTVPVVCCGEKMKELVPGVSDGAIEKHVPVVVLDGRSVHVTVGSVLHPMVDVHYIQWVVVETTKGIHKYNFKSSRAQRRCPAASALSLSCSAARGRSAQFCRSDYRANHSRPRQERIRGIFHR